MAFRPLKIGESVFAAQHNILRIYANALMLMLWPTICRTLYSLQRSTSLSTMGCRPLKIGESVSAAQHNILRIYANALMLTLSPIICRTVYSLQRSTSLSTMGCRPLKIGESVSTAQHNILRIYANALMLTLSPIICRTVYSCPSGADKHGVFGPSPAELYHFPLTCKALRGSSMSPQERGTHTDSD